MDEQTDKQKKLRALLMHVASKALMEICQEKMDESMATIKREIEFLDKLQTIRDEYQRTRKRNFICRMIAKVRKV